MFPNMCPSDCNENKTMSLDKQVHEKKATTVNKSQPEKKAVYVVLQGLHIRNVKQPRPDMYEPAKTQSNKSVSMQWNMSGNEQVHQNPRNKASKDKNIYNY